MKTLDDEWYIVIKAYKLTIFEILRNLFVLSYIACPRYPYIRVYRLYDNGVVLKMDKSSNQMRIVNITTKCVCFEK